MIFGLVFRILKELLGVEQTASMWTAYELGCFDIDNLIF